MADDLLNVSQGFQFFCWGLLLQDLSNRLKVGLQGLLLINVHGFAIPMLLIDTPIYAILPQI